MTIGDVVAALGAHRFAQIALVLAALAFAWVTVSLFLRRNAAAFERARFLPLEDDTDSARTHAQSAPGRSIEP